MEHEYFEEISAAASLGEATPEELAELQQHAFTCEHCRAAYNSYLNAASRQFANQHQAEELSAREAKEVLDSDLLAHRFFERAKREGVVFSGDIHPQVRRLDSSAHASRSTLLSFWTITKLATAAVLILVFAVTIRIVLFSRPSIRSATPALPIQSDLSLHPSSENSVGGVRQHVDDSTLNARLDTEIHELTEKLHQSDARSASANATLKQMSEDREALETYRNGLEARLREVQQELANSGAVTTNAQHEVARLQAQSKDMEASLTAAQLQIRDLNDQLAVKSTALDRERQLMQGTKDVTELMAARNLHIVDVVDTDPKGKMRPAFGRIFFTEGKSLIFYAYDLNEARLEKANYQYRIWATQEGDKKKVKSLGIFYADNKAQRRWVFKCEDAAVLSEIDSVFVTLEPSDADPVHPKGPNLMYAYLRGQPNHP